ncbi:ammonium permease ATO2-like protein [Vanrija pseudolonga]|uniref:Meiotically up-regulated gene 86 protein n=1 Tax=Vanrija pseudolonga TaxID=143232 RepID=A0AAF1BNT4_9TREE|nr:Meiotically up-regulated gene 86 protein [Vanrija pseudolonga]
MSSPSSSCEDILAPVPRPFHIYYDDDIEKGLPPFEPRIERILTPLGHPADFSQPGVPRQHRVYGNPTPLGLLSFGYGFFLLSAFTLRAQGVHSVNVAVPALVLFGGISQTLCGWWEMSLGNTYMATIFGSHGAFSLSYGAMYLPAFGVVSAYTLPDGTLGSEFSEALGLYFVGWAMVSVLFVMGSLRSSVAMMAVLTATALSFLTLAVYHLTESNGARIAGGVFSALTTAAAWWTAMAGYWHEDNTSPWVRVSAGDMWR